MIGPHNSPKYDSGNDLMQHINNALILVQTKIDVIQQAVAKCPMVFISAHRIPIPPLLGSKSEVTLFWQPYFNQHLLPLK